MSKTRISGKRPAERPKAAAAFGVSKSRINEADTAFIKRVFDTLMKDTGAKCVILVETTGALLAKQGDAGTLQLHTVASLLASHLAVAQAVAKHLGGEFTIMLHQGKRDNIQLTMAGKKRILAVIFGDRAPVGTVLMCARHAADRLEAIAPRAPTKAGPAVKPAPAPALGKDFIEAAKSRIDELLR